MLEQITLSSQMKNLYLVLLCSLVFSTSIAEPSNCFLEKYHAYSDSKKQWQQDITNLIERNHVELAEVARLYRNDQLVFIEQNLLAVELLLATKPEKINTQKPLNLWLALDADDEGFLASRNEKFRALLTVKNKNKKRAPHPDGDKLRSVMRTEIMQSIEFQNLLSEFNKKTKEIDNRICQ